MEKFNILIKSLKMKNKYECIKNEYNKPIK